MLGRDKTLGILEACLSASPAEATEITVVGLDRRLTRYTQNYIHQNVAETGSEIRVRAANGKRIGTASTNQMDERSLVEAVMSADHFSRLAPEEPDFRSLPEETSAPASPNTFFASTAQCPADLRAAYVDRAVSMGKEKQAAVAGALSTSVMEMAVVNTLGIRSYSARTAAFMSCVAMSPTSSGYAEGGSLDIAAVDPTQIAGTAIMKCLLGRDPGTITPGEYDVILEPLAVRDMLLYLSFMGLSATSYEEGSSFMSGRIGQKIVGDNITVWDDGLDPAGFPIPFDFEGVPKQKVMLIESGVAKGVVYDSLSAGKEGRASTGHSLGGQAFVSSMPMNLFMAGGSSSVEDMVASTKKGILVTRFHYVNPVHPTKAVITGMTRDGTFLVEDGKIVRGLKNLRFTESILGALSRVESLSAQVALPGLLSVVCPAIKVKGFAFTGVTEF